jgi:hypothetical protein
MSKPNRVETLPLKDQFKQALEEARIVLPGIQALFGFQFVAVFNASFSQLSEEDKRLHILALFLTALAVASAMAPAALHRQAEPDSVSDRLVRMSTCLLTFGMAPLGIAIALDFYVVANMVVHDAMLARLWGIAVAAILALAWFILPWTVRKHLKRPFP